MTLRFELSAENIEKFWLLYLFMCVYVWKLSEIIITKVIYAYSSSYDIVNLNYFVFFFLFFSNLSEYNYFHIEI